MSVGGLRDATLARSATDHPPPLPHVHPHLWHPTLRASRATGGLPATKSKLRHSTVHVSVLWPHPRPRELHFHLIPGLSTEELACYLPNQPFPTPGVLGNVRTELLCIPAPPPKALTYSNSPTFHLQSLIRNHFLSLGTIPVCHLSCPPNPSFSSLRALLFPRSEDTQGAPTTSIPTYTDLKTRPGWPTEDRMHPQEQSWPSGEVMANSSLCQGGRLGLHPPPGCAGCTWLG